MPVISEKSPLGKERILQLLPLIAGLTEKWSEYAVDEREGAIEHYFASADMFVRAVVLEQTATITAVRRASQRIAATRKFGWKPDQRNAPLTALVPVTPSEMQVLEDQCKARREMSGRAVFWLWLKMDMLHRAGKSETLFTSSDRFREILGPIWTAAMLKLDMKFEV